VYAIIEDGSRQYKVSPGDIIDVDLRELAEGQQQVEFDKVLMISDQDVTVGTPTIDGAKVVASIGGKVKDKKIYVHKLRRRKGYKRKTGHRQKHLRVTIDQVVT
jgi:large subunit ribosomal protein L21